MPTERVRRQIDRLLDEAEAAISQLDWELVRDRAMAVLTIDPDNADTDADLESATHALGTSVGTSAPARKSAQEQPQQLPTSFADGRYQVKKFLGEGGIKLVYLAHDTTLDREVAFALIKTEG